MAKNKNPEELEKLSNLEFPINKQKILSDVQSLGLPSEFMSKVKRISNKEYNSTDELMRELKNLK